MHSWEASSQCITPFVFTILIRTIRKQELNPPLAHWGLYRKHFRKTHAIQIAVHCISIRDRYTLSCRDVLLCLANLTHLPNIMVSIQSYGLKFHTDKTGEFTLFTVAAPSDSKIGPGAIRCKNIPQSRSLSWCNLYVLNPVLYVYLTGWPLGFACK